jgi:hypothetical protein
LRIAWAECELNLFADDIGFEKARDVFDLFMFCLTLNSAADKRGFMTQAMNKPARCILMLGGHQGNSFSWLKQAG